MSSTADGTSRESNRWGRLLYLAGPLDGLDYDGTAWYDEFESMRPDDVVGFMPGRAYLGADLNPREVNRANRAMIAASHGVFVNLSGPGRALGSIREIEFARSQGKTVYAVGDLSASLASYDLTVFPDLTAAAEALSAASLR